MSGESAASQDSGSLARAVSEAFAPDGPLARSVEGFSPRASQAEFAARAAAAIAAGSTLVAEAGTGTGKTFAYLVPALLAGGRVLISTGGKPLQDQLCVKDIPQVVAALRLGARVALLKGRSNYVCRYRLEQTEREGQFFTRSGGAFLRRIQRFDAVTKTGEKSELDSVPENDPIWMQVTSTRENCLGADKCPHAEDCWVIRARKRALGSDVIVVNHHLFLADIKMADEGAEPFLPECSTVILDEAHQLADIASDFFGATLALSALVELAADVRRAGLAGALDGADWPALSAALDKAARDVRLAVTEAGLKSGDRLPLSRFDAARLADPLGAVRDAASALLEAVAANEGRSDELDLAGPRLTQAAAAAQAWQQACSGEAQACSDAVRWVSVTDKSAQFHDTPLSFAERFRQARQRHPSAWILTSATLSAGGRFESFTEALGLEDAECVTWPSPFPYASNALFYVPQGLPANPNAPGFSSSCAQAAWPVIDRVGGKAFFLCTKLAALEEIAETLEDLMEQSGHYYTLIVQGRGMTRRAMIDAYRSTPNAVLVGSMSFWQGIDIRGEALSVVVIDKIPFAPPDDPVVAARGQYMSEHGESPFFKMQLPAAIVSLKQGAGRLIRDMSDRGVFILCDTRILTKSYGWDVIDSLPPFARTRRIERVLAFVDSWKQD